MQNNILGILPGLTVTALSLQVMRCSKGLDEQVQKPWHWQEVEAALNIENNSYFLTQDAYL